MPLVSVRGGVAVTLPLGRTWSPRAGVAVSMSVEEDGYEGARGRAEQTGRGSQRGEPREATATQPLPEGDRKAIRRMPAALPRTARTPPPGPPQGSQPHPYTTTTL